MLSPDSITNTEIAALVSGMNVNGYAVIKDFLHPDELSMLAARIEQGGPVIGTAIDQMSGSRNFLMLMRRMFEQTTGKPAPRQSLYHILRCLKGPEGVKHALRFHYDSYVLTALLPLVIPSAGDSGDLLLYHKRRGLRRWYFSNFIDKLLLENPLRQRSLAAAHKKSSPRLQTLKLNPGDLYLFLGYQTIHANALCDPQFTRATALFHFGDPHAESRLRRLTGRASARAIIDFDLETLEPV